MIRRIASLCVVGTLFLGVEARTAETYTITVKRVAKGDVLMVARDATDESKVTVDDGKGNILNNEAKKETQVNKYREEILEKVEGKKPTKVRRVYEKAQLTTGATTTDLPYHGKTVLIEKKGPKFRFQIEGGNELVGEAARLLSKEFDKENDDDKDLSQLVLPKTPVAVNDTWKLDMQAIAKELASDKDAQTIEFDFAKAAGTGKLLKAYKKDGRQFGEMLYQMEVPIVALGAGAQKVVMQPGTKLAVQVKVDACIDGTAHTGDVNYEFGMNAAGSLTAQGMTLNLKVNVMSKAKESTQEAKK